MLTDILPDLFMLVMKQKQHKLTLQRSVIVFRKEESMTNPRIKIGFAIIKSIITVAF